MSLNDSQLNRVSIDDCFAFLSDKVFNFRPGNYGEKYPKWPGMIGLEIEMTPLNRTTNKQLPLYGPGSLTSFLVDAINQPHNNDHLGSAANDDDLRVWTPEFRDDDPDKLMRIVLENNDQITFEPGGQIEYSSAPHPCLSDAILRARKVQERLDRILNPQNAVLIQTGVNPWQTVAELGLQMQKPRYSAMDKYFLSIGPYGQRMMRQTCSIQVNLDLGDNEDVMAKRFLTANLAAPLATAIFANSPICDREDTGYKSFRAKIWQKMDPSRCGFYNLYDVAKYFTKDSCVQSYLKFALNAKVIYCEALSYEVPNNLTFESWIRSGYKGIYPTVSDFQTHLSLLFPEVRPKGFLEIRSIDCLPRVFQVVPACFFTACLYDESTMNACLDILLPFLPRLEELWIQSAYGYQSADLKSLIKRVVPLVQSGFAKLPACFQGEGSLAALDSYIENFVARERTMGDEFMDALKSANGREVFENIEKKWSL